MASDAQLSSLQQTAAEAYYLNRCWADFSLYILSPVVEVISPPITIEPAMVAGTNELEFVYPIVDFGYKLSTSKAEDMYHAGMSMCKLHYTIEKMIGILMERVRASGSEADAKIEVAFGGFISAQRKAFEVIINLPDNVVVTNFEPGEWGEFYLDMVRRMVDKGYGHPKDAPRKPYADYAQAKASQQRSKGVS